jgi:hypothetical protein
MSLPTNAFEPTFPPPLKGSCTGLAVTTTRGPDSDDDGNGDDNDEEAAAAVSTSSGKRRLARRKWPRWLVPIVSSNPWEVRRGCGEKLERDGKKQRDMERLRKR